MLSVFSIHCSSESLLIKTFPTKWHFIARNFTSSQYSGLLRDSASNGSLNFGKAIHGQLIKIGLTSWTSLLHFYTKCGSFGCACQVLDEMPNRNVMSWTVLISRLVSEGHSYRAMNLYCNMKKDGVRPNGFTLVTALKACSMGFELDFGTQLHAEVIKIGVLLDTFVASAVVDLYARCGEMKHAERAFFCMPEKNVVTWSAFLNGYAKMGDSQEVLKWFCGMKGTETKFSKFILSTVFKSCARLGNLQGGRVVHCLAIKIGSDIDEYLGCCIIDMYSKCGVGEDAQRVFEAIKVPNVVAWTSMINCLDGQGKSQEAAEMFCLMRQKEVRPNQLTFASIVRTASNFSDLHYCQSIHACILKFGFESDKFLSNALITMYMKMKSVQNGWEVFNAMSSWDSTSWNSLLSGPRDCETYHQGPKIFCKMLAEGFRPDVYTFASILRSNGTLENFGFGKQVHAHIMKNGLDCNNFVGTSLIDMYAKNRCLDEAELLFNELNERDLFSWTVIIASYAQADQGEKAVKWFNRMQREGFKPNEFTLSCCFSGCHNLRMLESGLQLHSMSIKSGLLNDTYVASALIDMHGKSRCIEDAEAIFKEMDFRNTVSWSTIICAYTQHGQGKMAIEAFKVMLDEGFLPDEVTFIGVLSACSQLGLIEEAKMYFDSISKVYMISPTVEHCACMVNVFCRAGKFEEVERFMKERNLTENAMIWDTVLWGCKLHSNVEFGERAARKLFELEPELEYNYVTLSNMFAARGEWDEVEKIRALMCNQGIKKQPGGSWLEIHGEAYMFYTQDTSYPGIKEINMQMEKLIKCRTNEHKIISNFKQD
ncbi:hypothetical protein POUND7_010650 [Theobroma cacao]